jgi:hypothetical protein
MRKKMMKERENEPERQTHDMKNGSIPVINQHQPSAHTCIIIASSFCCGTSRADRRTGDKKCEVPNACCWRAVAGIGERTRTRPSSGEEEDADDEDEDEDDVDEEDDGDEGDVEEEAVAVPDAKDPKAEDEKAECASA